ncbi:acyl-CoA desaturase [Larkinella knui]|uniref:Acyl-CoA desaturase n=1 Tax=Larkinella knui TaxID=2025310 RepID=A0A3P1CNM5_9BACT|nr:acyl-CoA desaturase [Larkinella knui]RRB14927.1 acyl-CoA desaturase [Larkinella knui]
MVTQLKFNTTNRSQFFSTVRQRVNAYFKDNNLSPNANGAMWTKAIFFVTGYFVMYGLILSNQFGSWAMLGMALAMGMFAAFIGFNVSHDALHGAFSSRSWVNKWIGYSFYFIGASPYVWKITHNVVHHTYTNIPGHDDDIEIAPGLIRVDTDEPVRPWQRYQQWYAFPLYSLASISWVFRKDYMKFFKKTIGSYDNSGHPRREYIKLFVTKAAYYIFFIIIPFLVLDLTWWQFALGFVLMHIVEGLVLGLVFQLAHVVEGTSFPVPLEGIGIDEAWAVHQMRTTANFAPDSDLAAFLCGGLNRQIEHHLFPKVCHIHYPVIANIVRDTAHEFGLPYIENPTFSAALVSHYRLLKELGKEAVPSPVPESVEVTV